MDPISVEILPENSTSSHTSEIVITENNDLNGLSEYEVLRLQNIERNAAFLESLGLDGIALQKEHAAMAMKKRKPIVPAYQHSSGGTRKSSRLQKGNDKDFLTSIVERATSLEGGEAEAIEEREQSGDGYCNSKAIDRLVNGVSSDAIGELVTDVHTGDAPFSHCREYCALTNLTAIYSMEFHPLSFQLLLAAGKGGELALIDLSISSSQPDCAEEVLMAFRAHNRWISSIKFVNPSPTADSAREGLEGGGLEEDQSLLALTASDDSTLRLWDLSKVHRSDTSKGKLLCESDASLHSKGIFCMDYHYERGLILTGSKDRTVCVARIMPGSEDAQGSSTDRKRSIETIKRFEFHSKTVKTVNWQREGVGSGHIFASGGLDRSVCVKVIFSLHNLMHHICLQWLRRIFARPLRPHRTCASERSTRAPSTRRCGLLFARRNYRIPKRI